MSPVPGNNHLPSPLREFFRDLPLKNQYSNQYVSGQRTEPPPTYASVHGPGGGWGVRAYLEEILSDWKVELKGTAELG